LQSDILLYAVVPIVSTATCKTAYSGYGSVSTIIA
jgi:hypothetical protein